MGRFESKTKIVTDGLVLNLDPGVDSSITSNPPPIEVLVVAGGGGGGGNSSNNYRSAGGGGGGGIIHEPNYIISSPTAITVTVGAGGAGTQSRGNSGNDSSFRSLTAIGGGGGGGTTSTGNQNGLNGGSGGGGGDYNGTGGTGTTGQGNHGGNSRQSNGSGAGASGGGGGGAGGHGEQSINSYGAKSGGPSSSYLTSGTLSSYSAGGGVKAASLDNSAGNSGVANKGHGGQGARFNVGGSGGSGVVIIKYPGTPMATGGTITQVDGFTIHTFTSSGTFTPNGIGDLSGNNNKGNFVNGTTFTSHINGGIFGFDGSNDYITVPDSNTLDGFDQVTFEAWVNNTGNSYDRILSKNAFSAYNFSLSSANSFYIYINGEFADPDIALDPNQWYHLVAVYTGGDATFYVNGGQVGNVPLPQGPVGSNNEDLYIGVANPGFGSQFRGSMGPVRIYNRVLTEGDVTQNFIAQKDRFGIGLPLDGLIVNLDASNASSYPRTGTTIYDLSGTGNDATLYNGAYWSGSYGGTWYFDGSNDYAAIPDNSTLDLAGDKSLGMWVYLHRDPGTGGFAGKANSTLKGMALGYGWSGYGFLALAWNSSNTPGIPPDGADVGNWYYLSAVQRGGTRYIHVIGENGYRTASSTSGTHSWDNSLDFVFGQAAGYEEEISVGAVHIHKRALSTGEILGIYSTQKSRFGLS